jgi:parallel beta helix pectate lyase-like protein
VLAVVPVVACRLDQASAPGPTGSAALAQIVLVPAVAALVPGTSQQFAAYGRTVSGDSVATTVTFAATGGTVSVAGLYAAGSAAGTFLVMATSATTNLADTSIVTVQATPLAQLILVPAVVAVAAGGSVQFQVYGRTIAGDSVALGAVFAASGGSISAGGRYTAGWTGGAYLVIASSGALADTATVTITVPPGVPVYPAQSIQSAVDANPPGTTFLLQAGTFVQQSVTPKSGDVFLGKGEGVTILDGQNAISQAFSMGNPPHPSNVTIMNLTVTRYNQPTAPSQGMINMSNGGDPTDYATGWVIDSVEASYSAAGQGIRIGFHTVVRDCYVHHNHLIGMGGVGDSALIEHNELAFNNYLDSPDPSDEAGGAKFVRTNYLVVRGNYVHDNHGVGLWTDGWNAHVVYDSNRVEDNYGSGIMHEISLDAVIRNNIVQRNGLKQFQWGYGAGILVASSPNVEAYGNTVTNNARGIVGIGHIRQEDPALFILQNLYVHDNTVTMTNVATDASGTGNATGIVQDDGDLTYFTAKKNRFAGNTYHLGTATQYFYWMNGTQTEQAWVAYGQDVTGTFVR